MGIKIKNRLRTTARNFLIRFPLTDFHFSSSVILPVTNLGGVSSALVTSQRDGFQTCTFHHTLCQVQFCTTQGSGSLTEEQTHPGSWRNFATSYFLIALLSPNVSSRFLKVHNCGEMWVQKLFIDKVALKRLAGFRVKIDLFSSSFIFLFFLAPLCYIFSSLFLWLGGVFFFFFLISFTHRCSCTCSQLIITTSLHSEKSLTHPGRFSCLFARQDFIPPPPPPSVASPRPYSPIGRSTASWGAQLLQRQSFSGTHLRRFTFSSPRSVQSWLHVSFAICLSGWYSNLDHLAERRGAAQWAVGGGGGGYEEAEEGGQGEESFFFMPLQRWRGLGSWTLVTHHEFATCIKSLSNRWSHKFDLNAQSIFFSLYFFSLCFTLFTIWEIFWIFSFVLVIFYCLLCFLFYCLICLNIFFIYFFNKMYFK